jgi:cytochrome c oxidase subunit III
MAGPVRDVRHLPSFAFGSKAPIWWGNIGFIVIEASGFLMLIAVYLYLASQNPDWPMAQDLPEPLLGSVLVGYLIASEIANFWIKKSVHRFDLRKVRIGLILMSLIAMGGLALRAFEFGALNVRWDTNAYGSIVWALLFLHTVHLVTDAAETWVMSAMMFIGPVDARRFVDVGDNAEYWDFVVLAWLPVYVVIYWAPRWLAG